MLSYPTNKHLAIYSEPQGKSPGNEVEIQDGRHKFQPIRNRIKILNGQLSRNYSFYRFSRWCTFISKMAAPMQEKVGHVGKQPTSLNGELGSVSQISAATRIEQIDNRIH